MKTWWLVKVEIVGVVDVNQEKADSFGKKVAIGEAWVIIADEVGGKRVKGERSGEDEPSE